MSEAPAITLDSRGLPRPLELRRVVTPSQAGAILGLAGGAVVGSVRAVDESLHLGLFLAVATVLLLVVVGTTVVRGSLQLTAEGISVKGVGRRSHHPWRQVTSVDPTRVGCRRVVQVGLLLPDGTRRRMILESFSVPEHQLAPLLLQYRAHALVHTPVDLEGPFAGR